MAAYSKTPLSQKLGLKPKLRAAFLRMPAEILKSLQPLPENFQLLKSLGKDLDYLHFFAESIADLEEEFPRLKNSLARNGILWISWRKAKNNTDITDNEVRRIALAGGLVDVKVCAIDDIWSGLKLAYRLKDR